SSRRRHTRFSRDWSSDVCSSDLEQVHIWRRSYDTAPPGGESLRDTGARVWPYYLHVIQPHVLRGGTVLIAAHGNSLRALIMALDGLTKDEVVKLELATGVPIVYRLNQD